jgi:hypothetical protein
MDKPQLHYSWSLGNEIQQNQNSIPVAVLTEQIY